MEMSSASFKMYSEADKPATMKGQGAQFRRESCDDGCLEDCRKDPMMFDCEDECCEDV